MKSDKGETSREAGAQAGFGRGERQQDRPGSSRLGLDRLHLTSSVLQQGVKRPSHSRDINRKQFLEHLGSVSHFAKHSPRVMSLGSLQVGSLVIST